MKKLVLALMSVALIASCGKTEDKSGLTAAQKEFVEVSNKDNVVESVTTYVVFENTLEIKSILETNYSYMKGDAHGTTTVKGVNLKDGKLLTNEALLSKEDNEFFTNLIKEQIEKNDVMNLNGEKVVFAENPEINLMNAAVVFENDEILFVFPQYELGPASSGNPVFKFKVEDVKDHIKL